MTIVDYGKKMKIINDFYDQAVEIVNIVHDSIRGFHYVKGYNLLEEYDDHHEELDFKSDGFSKRKEIENRKRQLLIELGRAGEYAIKYILLLKQMEDYPNQTIDEFKKKAIYSIGEKGVGNTYVNQYHINRSIVDDIVNEKEKHKLQPLHDYSYLFYILKKLYPALSDKVYESFVQSILSDNIENSNFDKDIKKIMVRFPQCNWVSNNLLEVDKQPYIDEYDRIREESGDSFTTLRYIENNENNKQYDLNAVLYYLDYLIFHISIIHSSNNSINSNIKLEYSKHQFNLLADVYIFNKLDNKEHSKRFRSVEDAKEYFKHYEEEHKKVDEVFKIIEKNYESIMKSFNYKQYKIYEQITGTKINYLEMYENIINNIKEFQNYPQLFDKIPILLNSQNNIKVLKVLQNNGLNIENVSGIDSRIFCIPIEMVNAICDSMKEKDEEIIKDNRINKTFFDYLEALRQLRSKEKNPKEPPPLPLRRH